MEGGDMSERSDVPEDIFHLQNMMIEKGHAQRSPDARQFFTGGLHTNAQTGEEIYDVWDVTDYTPDGKNAHVLDDINFMIQVADWEALPNANLVDHKYAREICLSKAKPALILTNLLPNGRTELQIADGNHRLARASMQRRREYPAHMLTLEESNAIKLPQEIAKPIWLDSNRSA